MVPLLVLFLYSCGSPATSAPASTETFTQVPTTTPTATAIPSSTITPLPLPTLIPVTYVYGNEVSAAERAEFELGMRSTYAYLSEQELGSPGKQTVIALCDPEKMTEISYPLYGPEFHSTKDQVRSMWQGAAGISASNGVPPLPISPPAVQPSPTNAIILPIAIPTGGGPADPFTAIFVLTSIPKAFYDYPCYKVEYVAHDIWHTMQRKWAKLPLRSGYPMPKTGPEWLKEGSAQYFSFKVASLAHPDQCDFAKEFATKTGGFIGSLKLSSMESSASLATAQQDVFALGALAVDYLVGKSPKGIESLKDFYEAIGRGLSPDDAFQEAFGQSADTFYAMFDSTLAKGGIDSSVCVVQTDPRVKCLGRTPDKDFIFQVPFVITTQTNMWEFKSACALTGWGSNSHILGISVADDTQGACQVEVTFSANQKVTVDFVVPFNTEYQHQKELEYQQQKEQEYQQKLKQWLLAFDGSPCQDSISSGDFGVKCLGKKIEQDSRSKQIDYGFAVPSLDPFILKPLKLTSNCTLSDWKVDPPLVEIWVEFNHISTTCKVVITQEGSGLSAQVTFKHIGTSIASAKTGFDASYCADANFVSSGDFHMECAGRAFFPNYYSVDYQFKITDYDISSIPLNSLNTISSNCPVEWALDKLKSLLIISMQYNLGGSPIQCEVTFSPPDSGKSAEFTFNHLP